MPVRYLIDTHVFLWMAEDDERLSSTARERITDPDNDRILSLVSVWEIVMKEDAGKLRLRTSVDRLIRVTCEKARVSLNQMQIEHVLGVRDLPKLHKDPFDRLLISQARQEKLAIISADERLRQYPVEVVW